MNKPRYTRSLPENIFQEACEELERHGFVAERAPGRCEYAHLLATSRKKSTQKLVIYVRHSTQPLARLHGGFNLLKKGVCEPAAMRDQQRHGGKPAWLVIWRPHDEQGVCRKFLGYLIALPGKAGEKYRVPIDRSGRVEHALDQLS
ncbi:MAG: hypothetical protein GIKADHBN_01298 [Phycisphaerales bacterium]|nr:hypothetical protein [Phycisphaerales bacterium]